MSSRFAIARSLIVPIALIAGCAAGLAQDPDKIDDKPPIPPENPKKVQDAARFRIDKDKAIFTGLRDPKTGVVKGGIEDNRPLASEKQNADEYRALTEVMLHAAQFTGPELAEHGRRDLTPDDLSFTTRFDFRLDLVRFEGKLLKARRLTPTKSLEDSGFKELFEVWLVPDEESPGYPVAILTSQWPAEWGPLPAIGAGEPAGESVRIEKWAAVGAYSFKLMTYPGPGADPKTPSGPGWLKAPLLVGRAIVPVVEPAPKIAIDKSLRVFGGIRDDRYLDASAEFWEEWTAWNRVFMHVKKFSAEQLEAEANKKVGFPELFKNHQDYKLDLIYVQGTLVRVLEKETSQRLKDAGITKWYDGWIIPDGEPSGNPLSIAILELPPGVEPRKTTDPGKLINVPVTFAGYEFKRRRYESGEKRKDDPAKNIDKLAPFLIGRSVTLKREQDDTTKYWWEGFVPAVVGAVVLLGGSALTLGWWFRKGDRVAQAEIAAARHKNPFETA
jgi:hypothetical protein